MWLLEHDILLEGKRVWLRPGSQMLYGRTTKGGKSEDGKSVFIDHKAVSRQHMMIKVLQVPPGDGTKLHIRSQIEVTDLSCRQGTIIDSKTLVSKKEGGQIVSYDKMVLSGTEHTIKLVTSYPEFRLKWQPIVITHASKDNKTRSNKLHSFDIKTSSDFVYKKTTHVASQKRNLPKVLQGLIAGVHIVGTEFLDAIIDVATPRNDDPENFVASKLEEDFDLWWPKEKDSIPPAGAEPVPRLPHLLEPDSLRSDVFSGLTFVFLNENQYSSLHEPVGQGGGKALFFDVRPGKTTVDEYVTYVRSVAVQKRAGERSDDNLSVITIRLAVYPEGMEAWASDFETGVEQALNQRSILQNEFLDAILTIDISSLQKPPPDVQITSSMPDPPSADSPKQVLNDPSQIMAPSLVPEASSAPAEELVQSIPRKRPIRRQAPASRFTGFDDYEPPAKLRKFEGDKSMDDTQKSFLDQGSLPKLQSQAVLSSQRRRKDESLAQESIAENDQMEELFPAAAAVRRQRAATRAASASAEPETNLDEHKPKTRGAQALEKLQKAKKKEFKETDVREVTRMKLQVEEEKRRADEESLREALEGVDISEIRNLVQIADMEVRPREGRQIIRSSTNSERWNDDWNGRKNFKKFRRRGEARVPQSRKVIVALEEAPPKKGFGIGDAFLLDSGEEEHRRKRKTGRAGFDDDDDDDDGKPEHEPGFTRNKKARDAEVVNVEDSEPDDEADLPPRLHTSINSRTQRVEETQIGQTQTHTQTQRGSRKRGAATVAAGSSKRTKVRRRDGDSDDEETGFRFRKRA